MELGDEELKIAENFVSNYIETFGTPNPRNGS